MPFSFFKKQPRGAKRADTNLAMDQVLHARKPRLIPRFSQLLQLPRFLNSKEQALAGFAILLIAGSLLTLGWYLFDSKRIVIPATGGEYTEGLIGLPQLINPLYALTSDVDNDLTHLIYSGLLRYDAEQGLIPDLAESFEVSEDGKVYTFVLRDDIKWHDGKPLLIDDIMFTFSALQNPDYRSPLQGSYSGTVIEQVDEKRIRFVLSEPFAPFLSLLTIGILPSHAWQDIAPYNAALSPLNQKPIGTGPFEFSKLTKDSKGTVRSYELTRYANYHLKSAYLEKITFKFYPDSHSGIEALKNQNVEGLGYLPPEEVKAFADHNQNRIYFPYLQQYTGAFFNQNRNSALKDKNVRAALAHATNKQSIVDNALNGFGRTIESFILEGMIGEHANIKTYPHNPDTARQLLTDAGWVIPEDGSTRKKGEAELALEIVTVQTPELLKTAELLKSQWESIGVRVSIRAVTFAQLQNDILRERSYDVLLSGELYGIDQDPYAFWHSSQTAYPGYNLAQLSNRKADDLIELGRKTIDREKRAEHYIALQDLIVEDVSAIFLYQPNYPYITAKKIRGIELTSLISPSDRYGNITEWFTKTRRIFSTKLQESIEYTESIEN